MRHLSRRRFMAAGAFAAGAASIGITRATAADPQASLDKFGGFKVGIQSNALARFNQDMGETLGHITDLGLYWAEIVEAYYPITQDEAKIAEAAALLARHDVKMESFFLGDIDVTQEDQGRRLFEFAKKTGVSMLVVQPLLESFPILDPLVKEYDIKIAVHNHGPDHRFDRMEDAIKAVAPCDWRVGFCLDTGHCMRTGENPVEAVRRLGHRMFALHVRDHAYLRRQRSIPETIIGEGALDLKGLFRALRDVHFDGPISLEMYKTRADPLPEYRPSIANFAAAAQATV